MYGRPNYQDTAEYIYNEVTLGHIDSVEILLTNAASRPWFIADRDNIINKCLNIPASEYNSKFDRSRFSSGSSFGSSGGSSLVYSHELYETMTKTLLNYAHGVTLKKEGTDGVLFRNPLNGLTFLRFMKDISGLNFTDIKVKNKHDAPKLITNAMLVAKNFPGAENAMTGSTVTPPVRSSLVQQRESWQAQPPDARLVVRKEKLTSRVMKLP